MVALRSPARHIAAAAITSMLVGPALCQPATSASAQRGGGHIANARRDATVEDLVGLRDFGRSDAGGDQGSAYGVAPDGQRIALIVRQGDARQNRYRQTLVIVRADGRGAPIARAIAAQPVHLPFELRGLLTPNGQVDVNRPKWSPDGSTIAILRERQGALQVWGIPVIGGTERYLTSAPGGVSDFAWTPDGRAIVYATRAGLPAFERSRAREGRSGYHYDQRIVPLMSARPQPSAALAVTYRRIDANGRHDRSASTAERAMLDPAPTSERPQTAVAIASDGHGRRAWIAPRDSHWSAPMTLTARRDGDTIACAQPQCMGHLTQLWWSGRSLVYVRREGWGDSETALYRWEPRHSPHRLLATEDVLIGCDLVGSRLICGREGSLQPRRLWSFDVSSGRETILFDPNPAFAAIRRPKVRRLHWTGPFGSEGYGDLVWPANAPMGTALPTIVVQYRTRGFLRGGVGDEYPILAFAARGFAVLSVENTKDYATLTRPAGGYDLHTAIRLGVENANERRLQLGNLEAGIAAAQAVARLDDARMGVTGVSDAASSAVFALAHTHLFAAAALGSPTIDPSSLALGGPALQQEFQGFGYPAQGSDDSAAFYQQIAMTPNARTIATPILLQWSDDEYLMGIEAVRGLTEAHVPVDLYIYPGEHHVMSQPAHRLAVYRRNLAWFDYWLQRHGDRNEQTAAEHELWRTLRDQACHSPAAPFPIQLCTQASTSTSSPIRR